MVLKFKEYIQLNEVRRDIPFVYLKRLMLKLGYEYTYNDPNHKFVKTVVDKKGISRGLTLTAHKHHTGGTVDAASFTEMKKLLIQEYEYTGNTKIFDMVDWDYIGTPNPLKSGMIKVVEPENTDDYEVVAQLFKDVCVIKNKEGEYNLCRSEEDKTPLLDRWYPIYDYSKKLKGKMCLGYDVDVEGGEEPFGTHMFAIKPDGTLGTKDDIENYVVESVKNI